MRDYDGGALIPDDSGALKSGHATAYCPLPPADMTGTVSLYGPRGWTEQDDKPVKHELALADFQIRSGQAIQREPPCRVRPSPALAGLAITPAKGFGIILYLSPYPTIRMVIAL
ncbi:MULTISPECIES: hypothetical protein [unclassified Streptomyces]|uniref:hypothetical protein n=1 Tax=unclassified Streptomyces TaxID=2593676 RepID=UPI002E8235CD|nr:hypothetical protein [Streptomyces sp. NBC_00589]WTI41031.1 hypothetical protein OIC96_41560 [Streptomyces sp. NBC_00775]WUB25285.1 hypothetical protein OHA51_08170 [Streptomyces sp. NBC_00589]